MFSKDIGIDLGTANTLVYVKGKGIVVREPSVVAVDVRNDTVVAVGTAAKEMIGRTPGSIVAVRPLKDGVIADFDITATMLNRFIRMVIKSTFLTKPRVIVCIPSGVTDVERRAVTDAMHRAGIKQVELIEELVVEGAHGIHHAPGAGKLVREPQGFRAVLKDQKDSGNSILLTLIPHDGDLADDQAVAADLRAPVFFRNVPSEDLFIAAVRNEVRDRPVSQGTEGLIKEFPRAVVGVQNGPVGLYRDQAFLQGVDDSVLAVIAGQDLVRVASFEP